LVDRWFKEIAIDDLSIDSASYQQISDEHYQVDVCLKAHQTNVDNFGVPRVIKDTTPSWLGVLTKHPEQLVTKGSDSNILKLVKVNISQQNNCFSWKLKEKPTHVAIDPFYNQLDENRDNNVMVPMNRQLN